MKKILFLSFILTCTLLSFSQEAEKYIVKATLLKDPSMKYLYTNMDNELLISADGISPAKLIVSTNKGELSGSNGKYILKITPENMTRTNKFKIKVSYLKAHNDTVLLGISEFLGYKFQGPVVSIKGNKGGIIKKDVLLNADSLSLEMPNYYLKDAVHFKIVSFTVNALFCGTDYNDFSQNNGCTFTPEQKNFFTKLGVGQKLFVENIKVKDKTGVVRTLPSMIFKIAE